MNSVDDLPVGGAIVECVRCGLSARPPIVVADEESSDRFGHCTNKKACHVRKVRSERRLERSKAEKKLEAPGAS